MRRTGLLIGLTGAALLLSGMAGRIEPPQTELPASINRFGHAILHRQPVGNTLVSPFSLHSAMSMTAEGARGETARQMRTVLGDPADATYRDLTASLALPEIQTAAAIWLQQDYKVARTFIDSAGRNHAAEVLEADFRNAPGLEATRINEWVAFKTKGRVKDLIDPGILTELTRLVLIQCIHFKGLWQTPFDRELTASRPFYPRPQQGVAVPTMCRQGEFRHVRTDGMRMVELPYAGDRLAMQIILPDSNLKTFLAGLKPGAIDRWQTKLQSEQVRLYLPRFSFSSSHRLDRTLAEMGMPLAFGPKSDFSGISGKADLKIDAVIHKAFIEVNEEGTAAAAASGVAMGLKSIAPPAIEIHIDRPFVFRIIATASGTELFLGTVSNPRP